MSRIDIDKLESELQGITIKEINDHPTKSREEIAFELFVLASEKEQVGQLNDAADYYWKAFKLDDKVDLKYREKYFEEAKTEESRQIMTRTKDQLKIAGRSNRSNAKPLELNRGRLIELLDSYSTCDFVADDEEKPVYLQKLPYEVIENIMELLLIQDTPTWVDFSLCCKKLAFIGFRDKNIWSKLSQLVYDKQVYRDNDEEKFKYLIKSQWGIKHYQMLNMRPFIKYRGVYISKVSYMKEGARSENSNSWNLPYRIITYYRYYRFFPDGTCLKIITVLEPKRVIPKLHKGYKVSEDVELMKEDVREEDVQSPVDNFSNRSWLRIFAGTFTMTLQGEVETNCDGPVEKYRFIDKFTIGSTGKYHRHNKLQWVDLGFYDTINRTHSSLNRDNEKDFVFSRVKSYSY